MPLANVGAQDGSQYVGSAVGQGGFIGRWQGYCANGHGGNVLLRQRPSADYIATILKVAGSDATESDILNRESLWKRTGSMPTDKYLTMTLPGGLCGLRLGD